ncbi:MAG: transcription factor Opi1-domain-containing protein [Linnemannia gamsii]|nr:MAG: transcription factor Opi1-domain-containing protein [Linnemannia gamsii]
MPTAKDHSKAQPMSISQLCQQDSDNDIHSKHDLDHDPLDLNSGDESDSHFQSYRHNNRIFNNNGYSETSDIEDDSYQQHHHHRVMTGNSNQPDSAEQMAAEALGDMANASHTEASSSSAAPAGPFMSRMSSLPLVNSAMNSALKAYENTKQNSKVMKYGAEMVESSVKSLSKPVFEKLEPKLGQLDDFACRQLDKFEKVYPKTSDAQPFPSPTDSARSSNDLHRPDSGYSTNYFAHRARGDSIDSTSSAASSRPSFDVLRSHSSRREDATMKHRSDSQRSVNSSTSSFHFTTPQSTANGHYPYQQQQQQQVGAQGAPNSQQLSGWKGVVASVGSASAAGVAIFSEESMKSLKYCLQWLQYAVQHIDHQIGLLRAFLASLAGSNQNTEIVPSTAASTLASIKKEVVETLRKVISIVSRYAGAALPDPAKISVRQFILSMPVRWATLNNESVPSTPIGSPSLGPVDRSADDIAALHDTSERAARVLVLANESSDMLRSVSSIFKDSVEKAENWMDKLRYVGMTPQNSEGLPSWAPTGFPGAPGGGTMPGGFPGSGLEQYSLRQSQPHPASTNHHSHGYATPKGSPTRSLKSSPRLGSPNANHYNRHAYRQKSVMSGDEDSASESEGSHSPLGAMDDDSSFDEEDPFSLGAGATHGHGPMKRSLTHNQGNAVRRRKKRGKSTDVVAGLGLAIPAGNGHDVKQEPM